MNHLKKKTKKSYSRKTRKRIGINFEFKPDYNRGYGLLDQDSPSVSFSKYQQVGIPDSCTTRHPFTVVIIISILAKMRG